MQTKLELIAFARHLTVPRSANGPHEVINLNNTQMNNCSFLRMAMKKNFKRHSLPQHSLSFQQLKVSSHALLRQYSCPHKTMKFLKRTNFCVTHRLVQHLLHDHLMAFFLSQITGKLPDGKVPLQIGIGKV